MSILINQGRLAHILHFTTYNSKILIVHIQNHETNIKLIIHIHSKANDLKCVKEGKKILKLKFTTCKAGNLISETKYKRIKNNMNRNADMD